MPFIRSLSQEFIRALNTLYDRGSWWTHLADANRVFIGIRNETLNVYVGGGSIGRVTFDGEVVHLDVHSEYLSLRPNPTYIDVVRGQVAQRPLACTIDSYLDNFEWIADRVRRFAGRERSGENVIAARCNTVIDIEAEFITRPEAEQVTGGRGATGRIDLVCLHENKLLFWELKDYTNPEIRAAGEPEVCGQLNEYAVWLSDNARHIATQYSNVLGYFRDLHGAFFETRRWEPQEELEVDRVPRLLIFGFDNDQCETLRERIVPSIVEPTTALVQHFCSGYIRYVGRPRNVGNHHLR